MTNNYSEVPSGNERIFFNSFFALVKLLSIKSWAIMIIIAVDICEKAIFFFFDSYTLDFYGSISYFSIVLRNIMLHSNDIMPVWIYCQIVALPVLAVYARVGIDLVLY